MKLRRIINWTIGLPVAIILIAFCVANRAKMRAVQRKGLQAAISSIRNYKYGIFAAGIHKQAVRHLHQQVLDAIRHAQQL